jgi:hypothetical protein
MANEGFGVLSTIMSGATSASQKFSTTLSSKGAQFLFIYNTFTFSTDALTEYHVDVSDDGGTTWFICPDTIRGTTNTTVGADMGASENWRLVVPLGPVAGATARKVRVTAKAASTGSTLVVQARFDRSPVPVMIS